MQQEQTFFESYAVNVDKISRPLTAEFVRDHPTLSVDTTNLTLKVKGPGGHTMWSYVYIVGNPAANVVSRGNAFTLYKERRQQLRAFEAAGRAAQADNDDTIQAAALQVNRQARNMMTLNADSVMQRMFSPLLLQQAEGQPVQQQPTGQPVQQQPTGHLEGQPDRAQDAPEAIDRD